jgi:zinc protease
MITQFVRTAALLAVTLFPVALPLSAQIFPAPVAAKPIVIKDLWPQDSSDIPADPSVTWGVLKNGIRYAVMQHVEPPKRVTLRLYVRSGSLMEEENQRGLAHFFEHMAFNGTKHHPSGPEMVEYFQRLGMEFGGDTNAYTGFDRTVFKLELPNAADAMLDDGVQMLRDYADGVLLAQKEVDSERGVILAEKRDDDTVSFRIQKDSFEFSLPDSLISRRMPIGEESVIKAVQSADFQSYYHKWYTPDRLCVVIVGDLEPARAIEFIKKYFADMPAAAVVVSDPDLGAIQPRGVVAKVKREVEAEAVDISIADIRRLDPKLDTVKERTDSLAEDVACAIIDRRLQILAKKEGAVFSKGSNYVYHWLNFVDAAEIDVTCRPERWTEALALAETEIRRALEYGFTNAELAEAVANQRNDYEEAVRQASTRKSPGLADGIVASLSANKVYSSPERDLEIAAKVLDSLTPEKALDALRNAWRTDTRIIYVGGNLPEGASDEAALDAYAKSAKVPVERPSVVAEAAFAYTNFGTVSKVARANFVTDLNITQFQYANNVCVNIKPTDYERNVVRVLVRFGTGLLEAPQDKPGLAMLAGMTFTQGGLVAHSADDIARLFAGRNVQVSFAVQPDSFILMGTTSPRDLQDMLNLMAAYVTAPGYREEALRQARMVIPQLYAQLEHTPDGVMSNQVESFMARGDYRFGYPTEGQMSARTMDDLRAWLAGPLAHSRMEVSIVGDMDANTVLPMVARTFGSLPVRESIKPELAPQRVVHMQQGQLRTFEYETEIPKAVSVFAWPTEDQWDIARTRRMNVLASIIGDRLRVELREKLGQAYSPYCINTPSDTFKDYGYMLCISGVSPDKVEQAADAMRRTGYELSKGSVTQDELDRALKPLLEQVTQWRRNNMYWLMNVLASAQEYPVRLDWSRTMVDDLTGIKLAEINSLASTYLQPAKAIDIRIVPEVKKAVAPAETKPEAVPADGK